ncbi:ADP-ribosyltransferase domain-containing protein [Pseudomonas sp. NY11955]|uniref:ADP-ribosyltransferase domain-containing protein n=1 Tax=Pseudomonas sp. NY11955 TaxID=3400363 RepID=UPI003A8C3CB4
MNRLGQVTVDHVHADTRYLSLEESEFSDIDFSVDYLLVVTLPGDYEAASENQYPIVQYLMNRGVSLVQAHAQRAVDMHPHLPCWISAPLINQPFKRLVVFECGREALDGRLVWAAYETARLGAGSVGNFTVANAMLLGFDTQDVAFTYVLRQAFFASLSCAARVVLPEAHILVEPSQGSAALALFESLTSDYIAPPDIPAHLKKLQKRLRLTHEIKRYPKAHALGLTDRQFGAIKRYTRSSSHINSTLRRDDVTDPDYLALQAMFEAISTGLANLNNFVSQEGGRLFRGVRPFEGFESLYRVGGSTHELAYTSTSKVSTIYGSTMAIRFYMSSHVGKEIAEISDFPEEEEVLFDYGMQHLIMSTYDLVDMGTQWPLPGHVYKVYESSEDLPNLTAARFLHL